jgi:hypothetical protein
LVGVAAWYEHRVSSIGSWQWLEETGGNLTTRERLSLLPAVARTFVRFSADRLRLAFQVKARHSLSAAELWPREPDSALCREARSEGRELQSEPILQHGYRTWVFGAAFARMDGVDVDLEQLYSSALLHDAGLEHIQPNRCFTHRSASSVRDAALRAGMAENQALPMMDGIAMHITPGLRPESSAIGFYVQAGAMADLAGLRAWELPKDLRTRTYQTYPLEDVHGVLSACWHAEAKAVPKGRASFADRYGAFSRIVRLLPPNL